MADGTYIRAFAKWNFCQAHTKPLPPTSSCLDKDREQESETVFVNIGSHSVRSALSLQVCAQCLTRLSWVLLALLGVAVVVQGDTHVEDMLTENGVKQECTGPTALQNAPSGNEHMALILELATTAEALASENELLREKNAALRQEMRRMAPWSTENGTWYLVPPVRVLVMLREERERERERESARGGLWVVGGTSKKQRQKRTNQATNGCGGRHKARERVSEPS